MTGSQFISHIKLVCSEIYNHSESQSIAYILAKDLFGESKIDIILNPNKEININIDINELSDRLRSGEPIQYIIGKAEFCDLEFAIGKGALIPRPETEELINWIVSNYAKESSIQIMDIGTGSGCIAISLAKQLPLSQVTAIDIEMNAIYWADKNATQHNVKNINIIQQNALSPVATWNNDITKVLYDVIVSNPPYIPQQDIDSMELNVKGYEPHSALFVPDNDPLIFYRSIAISALSLLCNGGELYFEIYESFWAEMKIMLGELGYSDIEIKNDIHSKPRMCRCVKK